MCVGTHFGSKMMHLLTFLRRQACPCHAEYGQTCQVFISPHAHFVSECRPDTELGRIHYTNSSSEWGAAWGLNCVNKIGRLHSTKNKSRSIHSAISGPQPCSHLGISAHVMHHLVNMALHFCVGTFKLLELIKTTSSILESLLLALSAT